MEFSIAKDTSESEVYKAFGFQKSTDTALEQLDLNGSDLDSKILITISSILQGDNSVAQLSELLANINTDFRTDGTLDSDIIKSTLYNAAQRLDATGVRDNLNQRYEELGQSTDVPDFTNELDEFIGINKPFEVEIISNDIICYGENDGEIELNVSGGTEPFEYLWSHNSKTISSNVIQGLAQGSYSVVVTDANNYELNIDGIEIRNETVQIEILSDITNIFNRGNDGLIDITPNFGVEPYIFEWSDGSINEDLTDISQDGVYSVKVIDSNGCSNINEFRIYNSMVDIEGNLYRTVTINGIEWMADNLKTATYNNGNPINLISDEGTYYGVHWYNDDETYRDVYGGLYTFSAISSSDICPTGWKAATYGEWASLDDYLGYEMHDLDDTEKITLSEDFGFDFVFSGYLIGSNFSGFGQESYYWSNRTIPDSGDSWGFYIGYQNSNGDRDYSIWRGSFSRSSAFCLRCTKE